MIPGWVSLFEIGQLNVGNVVLIHGASGGVGHIIVQLAKAFNLRVIATCSRVAKAEFCRSLGPDAVVSSDELNFVDFALEFTGGSGVDAVIDFGYAQASMNMEVLSVKGKLIQLASSSAPASMDLRILIDKQVPLIRKMWFAQLLDSNMREACAFGRRASWAAQCAGWMPASRHGSHSAWCQTYGPSSPRAA
jgi:NADPH:quinone reductase-like Zn-dependent oxidoreductase